MLNHFLISHIFLNYIFLIIEFRTQNLENRQNILISTLFPMKTILFFQTSLLLTIFIIDLCETLVTYRTSLAITTQGKYQYFYAMSSASSNFVFMSANSSYATTSYPSVSTLFPNSFSTPLISFYQKNFIRTTQIRTFISNYVSSSYNNNSFLLFTSSSLSLTKNNFNTTNSIYQISNTSAQTIKEVIFGSNTSQILLLTQNLTLGNYSVSYFVNQVKVVTLSTNVSNSISFFNVAVSLNKFIISLNTGILVYNFSSLSNISTLILEKWISFQNVSSNIVSMSVFNTYLSYCYGTCCFLRDINASYIIVDSFNRTTDVISLQIYPPYIFVMWGTFLQQYDMDLKIIINSTNTSSINTTNITNYRMFTIYNNYIVFYSLYPNIYTRIFVYDYDNTTICLASKNCTNCPNTYYLNTTRGRCVKNYTAIGIIAENITDIIIQNVTNTNISMGQSNFSTSAPTPLLPTMPQQSNVTNLKAVSLKVKAVQSFGKSLTFLTLKFSPKFLISLTLFLDDLWYYKFHRHNYTETVRSFMQKIDLINQLRLSPWFLDTLDFINSNNVGLDKNQKYLQHFSFNQHNPQSIYFLNSSQQVYKGFFINLCLSFLVLKLFCLIFYLFKYKFNFCMKIFQILRLNTSIIFLISGLIQPNTIILAFNCSIQMLMPIYFDSFDRINISLSVLTYFWLLIYSISYYLLICNYAQKKKIKALLSRSKHTIQGCLSQTLLIVFRNLSRATIHAILIQNYEAQIICLALSDFVMAAIVVISHKQFQNKFIFLFVLLYNILFFVIDLLFYLNYKNPQLMQESYDNFIFILILILIGLSVLISVTILISGIKNIVKKSCNQAIEYDHQPSQSNQNKGFVRNQKGHYEIKVILESNQTNQSFLQYKNIKIQNKEIIQNHTNHKVLLKINNYCMNAQQSYRYCSREPFNKNDVVQMKSLVKIQNEKNQKYFKTKFKQK